MSLMDKVREHGEALKRAMNPHTAARDDALELLAPGHKNSMKDGGYGDAHNSGAEMQNLQKRGEQLQHQADKYDRGYEHSQTAAMAEKLTQIMKQPGGLDNVAKIRDGSSAQASRSDRSISDASYDLLALAASTRHALESKSLDVPDKFKQEYHAAKESAEVAKAQERGKPQKTR